VRRCANQVALFTRLQRGGNNFTFVFGSVILLGGVRSNVGNWPALILGFLAHSNVSVSLFVGIVTIRLQKMRGKMCRCAASVSVSEGRTSC
jgi:hypothetical protein